MNLCISMDFQKLKVIDKYSDAREKKIMMKKSFEHIHKDIVK